MEIMYWCDVIKTEMWQPEMMYGTSNLADQSRLLVCGPSLRSYNFWEVHAASLRRTQPPPVSYAEESKFKKKKKKNVKESGVLCPAISLPAADARTVPTISVNCERDFFHHEQGKKNLSQLDLLR